MIMANVSGRVWKRVKKGKKKEIVALMPAEGNESGICDNNMSKKICLETSEMKRRNACGIWLTSVS